MEEHIYLSNALEELIDCLKRRLFDPGLSPFLRKMVVVPNAAIKHYIMVALARDPDLKVVAGVQFVTLSQALRVIDGKRIPSAIELSLLIQKELEKDVANELSLYLSVPAGARERRVMQIAEQLSSLFTHYGIYGGDELEAWAQGDGWQEKIWRAIFSPLSPWSYPVKELKGHKKIDYALHVCGFSFLPKIYFEFFHQLGGCFYLLSPCQHYWGDLSPYESENGHRILATFGKAGRHFAKLFENSSGICERYVEREGNALQQLQGHLLHLEEGTPSWDHSVQLHAFSSKLGEVEALFEHMCRILPKEIKIVAPCIADYLPFIQMVFGNKLHYSVYDRKSDDPTRFMEGLLHLLDLYALRFEKEAVLKLFQFPAFVDKWGIDSKEVTLIQTWVDEIKIVWGTDWHNRQSYVNEPLLEQSEMGTWMWGLEGLLEALVTGSEQRLTIEFMEAELLGKCACIIETLKEMLIPLVRLKQPFCDWVECVRKIANMFFVIPESAHPFFRELASLASLSVEMSFENFKNTLKRCSLCHENASIGELQALQVGSITTLSSVPTHVTCLIGMHEGSFPRLEERPAFASLQCKDAISKTDEDRAQFIEILLSTREEMWISYVNIDERDGKKRQVSSVIEALKLKQIDPILVRDESVKPAPFFPEWHIHSPLKKATEGQELVIDIKHLSLLAKHPVQFYFNRVLQMYFDKKDHSDPEFGFSSLNRAILRQSTLYDPLEKVLGREKHRLPQGAFKKPALAKIASDTEEMWSFLEEIQLSREDIFSLDLQLGCKERVGNTLPPLRLSIGEGRVAVLFGKLTHLSPKGMIFHGTTHIKDLVKIWPLYLIYLNLDTRGDKPLLCTKKGETVSPKDNAGELLIRYIHYYELAKQNVSPFMPDWAPALIKGDVKDLTKAISTTYRSPFFPDPYMSWLAARDELPCADVLMKRWSPLLQGIL